MNLNTERLIIFTRYPEAGKSKTRLIPLLGAEGAAQLQRHMTEQTLKTAQQVQIERMLSLAIYFSGGSLTKMKQWLGQDFHYYPQSAGDLGQKLESALTDTYNQGITRVIFIGVDCLDITSEIICQAFDSLDKTHIVIGEAVDGGYYLIGLRDFLPQLFQGIDWGTNIVFQQTKTIAQQLNLTISYLPVLRDIDRPEDVKFSYLDQAKESE